jgi:integral membrane protein (TIGR01906 family)
MTSSPIRALGSLLVGGATILAITGASVVLFLNPIWVGLEQDRSGAAALTGYTPAQLHAVTGGVLSDLVFGPPRFDQAVDGTPVFDDRERAHMVDVRGVFSGFGILVAGAVVVAGVVAVAAGAASRRESWFSAAAGRGALALAGTVVLGGVVSLVAFDQAFEVFHQLFFPGGSYDFDPATKRLVQLFPIQFWTETSLAVGIVILVLCGIVARWGWRARSTA